jgi:Gpi18-like mannosyltransferase
VLIKSEQNVLKKGGRKISYEIHKLVVCNKEEFPVMWKESIIVPIYKKGNKTDFSNYRGLTLLPNM